MNKIPRDSDYGVKSRFLAGLLADFTRDIFRRYQ